MSTSPPNLASLRINRDDDAPRRRSGGRRALWILPVLALAAGATWLVVPCQEGRLR